MIIDTFLEMQSTENDIIKTIDIKMILLSLTNNFFTVPRIFCRVDGPTNKFSYWVRQLFFCKVETATNNFLSSAIPFCKVENATNNFLSPAKNLCALNKWTHWKTNKPN